MCIRDSNNIAELSEKVLEASSDSGINICLLPVLYERGGCDGRELIGGQLRFKNTFDSYAKLIEKNTELTSKSDNFSLGVAAHSLRAVNDYNIEKMISLIEFRKEKLIQNRKVFKDENQINEHISFIKDEISVTNKAQRMIELKNWLDNIKK